MDETLFYPTVVCLACCGILVVVVWVLILEVRDGLAEIRRVVAEAEKPAAIEPHVVLVHASLTDSVEHS